MKKKHVTFGCAGQHEVRVYSSDQSASTHKKRSRNYCINYRPATRECAVLGIECVGPSNSLCKDYHEPKKNRNNPKDISVGRIVNHARFGVGMIIEINGSSNSCFFTVRFLKGDIVKRFNLREIQEILSLQ